MKVFLDKKGNAQISRKEIKEVTTSSSFVFYEKAEDIVTTPGENIVALTNEKLGKKYWIIPFEPKGEVIHMKANSSVELNCTCKSDGGDCVLEYKLSGGTLILTCYSPHGCGKCVVESSTMNGNYLMIKAESVSIVEK